MVRSFPVSVVNVPEGKQLSIYPSNVTVNFRTVFPMADDITESLGFYIDYNDYASSKSGKCPVYISSKPKDMLSYEIEPSMLDCVLEDKL